MWSGKQRTDFAGPRVPVPFSHGPPLAVHTTRSCRRASTSTAYALAERIRIIITRVIIEVCTCVKNDRPLRPRYCGVRHERSRRVTYYKNVFASSRNTCTRRSTAVVCRTRRQTARAIDRTHICGQLFVEYIQRPLCQCVASFGFETARRTYANSNPTPCTTVRRKRTAPPIQ